MKIDFKNQVAIVTGAGQGLGRSHALALAARGAKVVVNDLGGAADGSGGSITPAQDVVDTIIAAGGEAMVNGANVAKFDDVQNMVAEVMEKWGRVDILINNAGILRDKSFSKMDLADFQLVLDVHLMGSVNCTKAVWEIMKEQGYGRIAMTTSSSGMYGNFGQSNYGAAKAGLVGFMNTLCIEGAKYDIRVNALSPVAHTRMTEGLIPEEALAYLTPESVTAGLLTLVHENAPNRTILCAGAGGYARTIIYETDGIFLKPEDQTPENVMALYDQINDPVGQVEITQGFEQSKKFLEKAMKA
ncbi:MAG TPA: SDR family NAD(P)-dependent oxidoreductase [Hellea balneolensis]|uniref:SDR family NAD(P)-dependent oxidoreductase n=1 Tax=Hellea balneolensis TaxID=287478 RepID=A0A7C3G5P2_9PROT|nr:SDR family NAD(P)-dependent oxidoreductase [Hellea balneolensis]